MALALAMARGYSKVGLPFLPRIFPAHAQALRSWRDSLVLFAASLRRTAAPLPRAEKRCLADVLGQQMWPTTLPPALAPGFGKR